MNKGVIAVAVLVAGGAAAMPFVSGKVAESETRAMLATMNEKPEQYGEVTIKEYNRGYASSTVKYDYELPPSLALMTGSDETYSVNCNYAHGMLGVNYDCNLLDNPGYKTFVDAEFSGEDPLTITGEVSLTGGWSQDVALKAIDAELDGGVLKVEPSVMTVKTDKDFSVYNGEVKLGKLDVSNADGALNMDPSSLSFNLKPTNLGLYAGEYTMSVGDLEMLNEGVKANLKGMTMTADAVERGDVMDAKVDLKLASFVGNGASAENVNLKYEVLGLNSQALVDYQDFATQMQADLLANLEAGDSQAVDANQMLALLPIIERMLDEGLTLTVMASGDIMQKPNSVDLNIELLKKTSFTELSALAFNPESVLSHFDVNLAASLNQELIQSNPQLGLMIGNSPLFTAEGDNFKTQLKIGEKSALNGKDVSFQELMGLAMAGAQPQMAPTEQYAEPEYDVNVDVDVDVEIDESE